MTSAAAFILKDWLGYNVELVHLENLGVDSETAQSLRANLSQGMWSKVLRTASGLRLQEMVRRRWSVLSRVSEGIPC